MHSELVTSPHEYNRKSFPNFGRPKIIGFLSLDSARSYHSNTSQLKFARTVKESPAKFDLNKDLHKAKHRADENKDEKISHLLQFLLDQEVRLGFSKVQELNIDNVKFFCYRGLLTCVACTPYENRESWRLVATLYKGAIYLCARDTPEKKERERNKTERDVQFTSWGYKFEQYVLSDTPTSEPDISKPTDENEEFSLIFTNHINRHTLVYGAEMDGIRCDRGPVASPPVELGVEAVVQYLEDKHFIELKTNRHIEFPNQENNFRRYKTKKWWCQSFLAGVDTVLCGLRNDDGLVEELKVYRVQELPKIAEKFWNPSVCFNFLDTFLTYVKRCLVKEVRTKFGEKFLKEVEKVPQVTLHFEWSPRTPVRVTTNYNEETDAILPKWFLDNYVK